MVEDNGEASGGEPGADNGAADAPALKARVSELAARNRELKARVADLEPVASGAAEWQRKATEAAGALDAERKGWADERALMRAGLLDDEARDVARVCYQRLDEATRPATIADYVEGLRAEGAEVPRSLQPWLAPQASSTPAALPRQPAATATARQPPAAAAVDRAALVSAREDWLKAGKPFAGAAYDRFLAVTMAGSKGRRP